ncbi:UDP-N-acetylmuramoyl-L-alanyl-D-glutamate--2,6-diaminopimelate ligase [Reinekea blandensis]|uniref:UDP-N-acetylmuramoyl-L-alanyl-D-glutamate--2,6-diaminopimelate ligase n=1 Tax=Reinekea blandensis MED297 TaxID=314283 RepID=A4BFR8_9GAMM|nr:UDP-N-acetylmuramoyl-L-alanyl-D-glutamate--2,6-diaminopimelate ligase [Reinekea blandensis]EAR08936.1 UDP-N-acetylmuramoylalanyl-D-glutamate--2,6-diaminopimelate ligase [Reinekea sp. MED297] [Reinekea blandensis MED297]
MISMMDWLPEHPELAGVKAVDITLDSREVTRGSVFIALKGFHADGHDFIQSAIDKGAVAILCERRVPIQHDTQVPVCVVDGLRDQLGELAHRFYGSVTHKLRVIGITGTNGKTSTCQYVAQSLDFLGRRCGIIGTNGQGLWGQLSDTLNTTPDVIRLHEELSRQQSQGAEFCAMEVSSHGLDQGRVDGLHFSTAVFTNLSRDHLDYHHSMEAYFEAKWRLMRWPGLRNAVVNLDDEWVQKNRERIMAERVWTYALETDADVQALEVNCHEAGIDAKVKTPETDVDLNLRLLGRFNLSNALAALTVMLAEGVPVNTAARVISNCNPVKGRMETLRSAYSPTVVVDYAHTPDALEKALQSCREHVNGRLVVIFGCGGDRDGGKRPEMARVAEQYADVVVVTDDNPRTEPSARIIADIEQGFSTEANYRVIPDRREAIVQTLNDSERSDVVLIAGKGHESYQEIDGVRHPFSDQDTVLNWQEAQHVE